MKTGSVYLTVPSAAGLTKAGCGSMKASGKFYAENQEFLQKVWAAKIEEGQMVFLPFASMPIVGGTGTTISTIFILPVMEKKWYQERAHTFG